MEIFHEWQVGDAWSYRDDETMPIEALAHIVREGFTLCEGDCVSRSASGDNCRCVRSVFPSPAHYQLYKELRKCYLRTQLAGLIYEARATD